MPLVKANKDTEAMKIQALIVSDPELKQAADDFDKEYEFRRQLVLARQEAEIAMAKAAN